MKKLIFWAYMALVIVLLLPCWLLNTVLVVYTGRYNWPTLRHFWHCGIRYGMYWNHVRYEGLVAWVADSRLGAGLHKMECEIRANK